MSDETLPATGATAPDASASDSAPIVPADGVAAATAPAPDQALPAQAKTIVEAGDTAPEPKEPVKADWPDDWREKLASGDEKMLTRLKRFQSPANVLKSWRELEAKVSSGELKSGISADATPEQAALWRKENGIPEKPDDYKFDLGGIVPSEADKPMLDSFKGFAHGENMSPQQATKAVRWFFEQQERAAGERATADKAAQIDCITDLKREWGAEYRGNLGSLKGFAEATMPPGLMDRFMGARMADGRIVGDDPDAIRWFTERAHEHSPGASLMPAGTSNVQKGVDDRISEIQRTMRDSPRDYWGNQSMQDEFSRLLSARDRAKTRAA